MTESNDIKGYSNLSVSQNNILLKNNPIDGNFTDCKILVFNEFQMSSQARELPSQPILSSSREGREIVVLFYLQ